jgi:23S rRNA pseudouridine1911/1915/1917 synthase
MVVAKTDRAHRFLSDQLQDKSMQRLYQALVQGCPEPSTGTISAPLGRHPKQRDKMMIRPDGRKATTHWEVFDQIQDRFSWLRLRLETGRTHQIRVHLASIGHPVLDDPMYGSGLFKQLKVPKSGQASTPEKTGQLLQAYDLSFIHPVNGQQVQFSIPTDQRFTIVWEFLNNLPGLCGPIA